MPFMINGCGTTVYWASGDKRTGCFDAVEWFVIFFAPLIPLKCVHTFNWSGRTYRAVPLRWSWGLVGRSFLGGWRWWLIGLGVLMLLIVGPITLEVAVKGGKNPSGLIGGLLFTAAALMVGLSGVFAHVVIVVTDARNRRIRKLLGPYQLGNADPALLRDPPDYDPAEMFGTPSFADAAADLLQDDKYEDAMWAARLCVALEDRAEGERLTDDVLAEAGEHAS
jgi:hypothetical protein